MKNYTSQVSVSMTVSRIEQILAKAGIRNILKDYNDGEVAALYFTLPHPTLQGSSIPVRLPANIGAVMQVLSSGVKRNSAERNKRLWEQSRRTAWKLMQDWVEVQLSLVELQQVEALQVFLPYVWTGQETLYARMKSNGFKALPVHEIQVLGTGAGQKEKP